MASLSCLASALESYRGRDRLIRVLGYCCQLVGGVLVEQCPTRSEVGTRLLVVSTQLSHCRTILRLFDDLSMFVYTKQYGLGAQEEDTFVRWVSVLGNLADQLYYPCEHVAWAADARVLHVDSSRWWTLSTALWALSLLLGVASIQWNCCMAIKVLCALPAAALLFQVPVDAAETETEAAEPHGALHQPAAPGQAEGHGGADAVGSTVTSQQPG
ncbi:peroxisomal membrane protein 11C isoform X2 [Rhinopithecus roxellana]|uniref:peroxisomal membrane protein 11C isoform X2 n=1 Tax=Rhinopithecus roxellana TaxID=61622 RepID=UPI0012374B4D|nr:peroxisomal membrane protein 11C isoform X2 [Rhinopithecus roxellana]